MIRWILPSGLTLSKFDTINFNIGLVLNLSCPRGFPNQNFMATVPVVYKLKKMVGSNNFSAQFIKLITHYKKIGYKINVLQQTACLVVNPITVGKLCFPL